MIYLDNAATTRKKPDEVFEAFQSYINEIGVSPGRGSYQLGIEASRMLYQARKTVGSYFGLSQKSNVIFTKNSTEAINMFVNSFLNDGGHAVISSYEHNAVLRPLHTLKEKGIIDYSIISREDLNKSPSYIIDKYFRENTKVFITTLASNLTGRVIFRSDLNLITQKSGVVTLLDASQGAGKIDINMSNQGIDYLAFTGHKDLMALPGVGGLCCSRVEQIKPLLQGGTGILGDLYVNPKVFPEGLEAGTLNMPAIWALKRGLDYIVTHKSSIKEKDNMLTQRLVEGLKSIDAITLYDEEYERVGVVGFNLSGKSSSEVVERLSEKGICARGGIHCAITAHKALGTEKCGMIRLSPSFYNTIEEIENTIDEIRKI